MAAYIEFKLPSGAGGMAAGYRSQALRKRMNSWAEQNNTSIETHIRQYRFYVEFYSEQDLTLFCLQWPLTSSEWDRFTVVKSVPEMVIRR